MKKTGCIWLAASFVFSAAVCFSSCETPKSSFASYEIVCEYRPEDASVTGTVKVSFENRTQNELSALKFQLYPNAYRKNALFPAVEKTVWDEVYYAGASYGGITVSSVLGAKGWEVDSEDENILTVTTETPLYPGDGVVLDIGFTTRLPKANHRLGVTEKTVNLGQFYPVLCGLKEDGFRECVYAAVGDPFYSDCADYLVNITAPKEYELACSGAVVEEKTLESKKKHTVSLTNAREFAAVLSSDFAVKTAQVGKTQLNYYYLSDADPAKTLGTLKEAVAFYSSAFGEYAYGEYTLVQTSFPYGGMEYPTLTMIEVGLNGEALVRSIAHEAAHQWWYAAVGNDQIENAWQDEGLSEYSAALFFDAYGGYGLTRKALVEQALENYRSYCQTYLQALGWVDMRMTRPLREYLSEYEYASVSCDKAVVMFDALRESVGEKKFLSALKKYYAENKFSTAKPESLIGAFERTGVDTAGFFESFLNGKGNL